MNTRPHELRQVDPGQRPVRDSPPPGSSLHVRPRGLDGSRGVLPSREEASGVDPGEGFSRFFCLSAGTDGWGVLEFRFEPLLAPRALGVVLSCRPKRLILVRCRPLVAPPRETSAAGSASRCFPYFPRRLVTCVCGRPAETLLLKACPKRQAGAVCSYASYEDARLLRRRCALGCRFRAAGSATLTILPAACRGFCALVFCLSWSLRVSSPSVSGKVDLPGYGHAVATRHAIKGWLRMIKEYITTREELIRFAREWQLPCSIARVQRLRSAE